MQDSTMVNDEQIISELTKAHNSDIAALRYLLSLRVYKIPTVLQPFLLFLTDIDALLPFLSHRNEHKLLKKYYDLRNPYVFSSAGYEDYKYRVKPSLIKLLINRFDKIDTIINKIQTNEIYTIWFDDLTTRSIYEAVKKNEVSLHFSYPEYTSLGKVAFGVKKYAVLNVLIYREIELIDAKDYYDLLDHINDSLGSDQLQMDMNGLKQNIFELFLEGVIYIRPQPPVLDGL